jgi:hypothetical protein
LKAVLYTNEHFAKATKMERLYMHMMQPDLQLTDAEDKYLDKLKSAFSIFSKYDTRAEMYAAFDQVHSSWLSERHKIFKDCQELFGRIDVVNPTLLRGKLTEQLMSAMTIAREDGDIENLTKIALAIAKINRLDKLENEVLEKPQPPSKVVFFIDDSRTTDSSLPEAAELS